jgi:hypothetical protein
MTRRSTRHVSANTQGEKPMSVLGKLNFFNSMVKTVENVIKGIRSTNFTTMMVDLVGTVPDLIKEFRALWDVKKDGITVDEYKQIIDDGLEAFDNATGLDDQGVKQLSLIKGMPIDKQEETLDALKIVIRNILYCEAKVTGYTE